MATELLLLWFSLWQDPRPWNRNVAVLSVSGVGEGCLMLAIRGRIERGGTSAVMGRQAEQLLLLWKSVSWALDFGSFATLEWPVAIDCGRSA